MRKSLFFVAFALLLVASSCGSYRRQVYLQDMKVGLNYPAQDPKAIQVRKSDKLAIYVTGSNPALAAPFNLTTAFPTYDPTSGDSNYTVSEEAKPEYVVDNSGDILFPILGNIHVEGLTLSEVKTLIAGKIREENLMRDPIVNAEFVGFQVTVLGEVGNVGNYNISKETINIFEVLAMARDLTQDAKKSEVWVIRTEGGQRKIYELNLRSKSVYDSPAFFLRQDDMVYARPRRFKTDASFDRAFGFLNLAISTTSLIVTTFITYKIMITK